YSSATLSPRLWVTRCHSQRRTGTWFEQPSRPGWPLMTSAPWPSTCGTSNRPPDATSGRVETIRGRRWMEQRDPGVPTGPEPLDERRRRDDGRPPPCGSRVALHVTRRRPAQQLAAE